MARRSATLMQVATALVGVGVVAVLLWEPHLEGRNAHASLREIYLGDRFLAFVYVGAIPFLVATYQAARLAGWVGSHEPGSSERAAHAAHVIRSCAGVTVGLIVVAVATLLVIGDERPPVAVLGVLATVPVALVAASAAVSERALRTVD